MEFAGVKSLGLDLLQMLKYIMSDRSQIEEIKTKLDIIDIARGYLPSLKKSGTNHFALCPFHNEKTPSFSLNSELGIYKCFGCGESGDAISFIQKMEGLDFPGALELAAGKAGITLKKTFTKADKERQKKKERILEANKLTTQFFSHMLEKHKAGEKAREYIRARKIRKAEIKSFQIGYAPESFSSLLNFLKKKDFSENETVDFGLAAKKNNKIYDKFRGRLMFPVTDVQGQVVGFSGRLIDKDTLGPKYLNSPETQVYNKSSLLYGLYQGKEQIRKRNFAIITEGQIDVISSHKEGVKNIVAPLGTALTEAQLKLLKRYCDTVYLSFDTDLAGERALVRSLELLHRVGLEVSVIHLGEHVDADELIQSSPKKWALAVRKAEPVIDHMIRRLSKRIDLGSAKGKVEFAKEILPLIKTLADKIQQSHYIKKASVLLDTDEEVLRDELDDLKLDNTEEFGEKLEFLQSPSVLSKEEYLVALIIQNFGDLNSVEILKDDLGLIGGPVLLGICEHLVKSKGAKVVSSKLDTEEKELFEKLALMPIFGFEDEGVLEKEIQKTLDYLRNHGTREEVKRLKTRMKKAEAKGEDMEKMVVELNRLSKKLKA